MRVIGVQMVGIHGRWEWRNRVKNERRRGWRSVGDFENSRELRRKKRENKGIVREKDAPLIGVKVNIKKRRVEFKVEQNKRIPRRSRFREEGANHAINEF